MIEKNKKIERQTKTNERTKRKVVLVRAAFSRPRENVFSPSCASQKCLQNKIRFFFLLSKPKQFLLLFLLLFLFLFPHFQLHQRAHARGDDARALVVLCSLMLVGIEGGKTTSCFGQALSDACQMQTQRQNFLISKLFTLISTKRRRAAGKSIMIFYWKVCGRNKSLLLLKVI